MQLQHTFKNMSEYSSEFAGMFINDRYYCVIKTDPVKIVRGVTVAGFALGGNKYFFIHNNKPVTPDYIRKFKDNNVPTPIS